MKVKCCYNCKYFHDTIIYNYQTLCDEPENYCDVKDKKVAPDEKCESHMPKDIMVEFEEDRK